MILNPDIAIKLKKKTFCFHFFSLYIYIYCNEFPLEFLIFRDMDGILCYLYKDYGRNRRVSRLKRST